MGILAAVRYIPVICLFAGQGLLSSCTDPASNSPDVAPVEDTTTAVEVDEEAHWDPGPVPGTDGPLTFNGVIQPILYYYCTPCHLGKEPKACDGFACFVDFYDALFYDAYNEPECSNMVKWECGMVRVYKTLPCSGSPDGLLDANNDPIVVQPNHLKLLEAWIEAGLPQG